MLRNQIINQTKINDCITLVPSPIVDHRGGFYEIYNLKEMSTYMGNRGIVEMDISSSIQNVFKGLHGDSTAWKSFSCVKGVLLMVVIDIRKDSSTYGNIDSCYLDNSLKRQIIVPPGVANGHYVLSERGELLYMQTEYYDISRQFTVNCKTLDFNWKGLDPDTFILSDRDANGPFVEV